MKKPFFLLLFLGLGFSLAAQGYGEYFRRYDIYGGAVYATSRTYIYGIKYQKTPSNPAVYDTIGGHRETALGPIVGMGWNLPFATFAHKNMSIGAHIAGNIGFMDGLSANFPIGLQYKFGTDASLDCEKPFGFSVSGGYNILMVTGDVGEGIFKYPYVAPEINFTTGRFGLMKIKAYMQFTEQYFREKTGSETHHTYLKVPFIVMIGFCPHYDD